MKPADKVTYPVPPKPVPPEDTILEENITPQLENTEGNPPNPDGEAPLSP